MFIFKHLALYCGLKWNILKFEGQFLGWSNIFTHSLRVEHEGFRYNCEHCPLSYKSKPMLTDHLRKNHPEVYNENKDFNFLCDLCSKVFRSEGMLLQHTAKCQSKSAKVNIT